MYVVDIQAALDIKCLSSPTFHKNNTVILPLITSEVFLFFAECRLFLLFKFPPFFRSADWGCAYLEAAVDDGCEGAGLTQGGQQHLSGLPSGAAAVCHVRY
jgi:hypothetical protein